MRGPALPLALATLLAVSDACRPSAERPAADDASRAGDVSNFRLTIVQSGGIAGTVTTATADGATLTYTLTRGGGCAEGAACPASDSASGALDERDLHRMQSLVSARWDAFREDYGRSEQAADLYAYEFDIVYRGRRKHLVADDLTLPADLRAIRDQLFQSIDAARGR